MSLAHTGMPVTGSSYGGRLFWVPRSREGDTLHFGFSYSIDTPGSESLSAKVVDIYGGRRGFSQSLGFAGAGLGHPPTIARRQLPWKQLMRSAPSLCKPNTQP